MQKNIYYEKENSIKDENINQILIDISQNKRGVYTPLNYLPKAFRIAGLSKPIIILSLISNTGTPI